MPYRPCVGVLVLNGDGKALVARRGSSNGPEYAKAELQWQLPQGGIDNDEPALTAARRELFEETSIRSVSLLAEARYWFHYDLPDDVLGKALHGKYRGQTQKWFAFRFEGDESEIDVLNPGGGAHPAEFVEWRWEVLENLPQLIVPFKRVVYANVVREFRHLIG